MRVRTVDYHTAGEPFRIVCEGTPPLPGTTVAQRRVHAQSSEQANRVRRLLVDEPRGHADMYGCYVVEADDDGADFGVLFWHREGYSTACGHGTIALGVWATESGRVTGDPDGDTEVVIDVPSGRVTATVSRQAGRLRHVAFRNVESYPIARDVAVTTSRGPVSVDIAYGGAIYACVDVSAYGLRVDPEHYRELVSFGREVKALLTDTPYARHANDDRLSGIYGTICYEDLGRTAEGPHQRNVTIFADGEADRSPCGSGTSARVALLADDGTLGESEVLCHESIVGTRFAARAHPTATQGTVVPEVIGTAYRTGEHTFLLDPNDDLDTGFCLR